MNKEASPFFSVIIPVYNKEKSLTRSITSVLNQSFNDFELIIVCDPSTDNSNEVVAKFTDPRIRVFYRNEPGPGGYAARNMGIKKAKAKWIVFLDADDEFLPGYFISSYAILKKGVFDVVISSYQKKIKDRYFNRQPKQKFLDKKIRKEDAISFLYKNGCFNTNSIIISSKLVVNAGCFPIGKNYRRGGDVDTWLRVFLLAKGIYCSSKLSSIYHIDDSGVVSSLKNANGFLPVLDTVEANLNNPELNKVIKKELKCLANTKILSMIRSQLKAGYFNYGLLTRFFYSQIKCKQIFILLYILSFSPFCLVSKYVK